MAFRRVAVLGVVTFALVSCHSYDELPRARCEVATHDCRPGEACRSGYCWGDRSLELTIAPTAPMNLAILGTLETARPMDVESRLITQTTVEGEAQLSELPSLTSWVLVWDGARDEVCAGDRFVMTRAPDIRVGRLRLRVGSTWEDDCFTIPTALGYADPTFHSGS